MHELMDIVTRLGLEPADITELLGLISIRSLSAGEIWLRRGSTSQQLAYIKTGLIRMYSQNEKQEELTFLLRWEDQWIAAIDSLVYRAPSRFVYVAMEDTVVIELNYAEATPIIDTSARLSALRSRLLLHMLADSMIRVETFVLLSPEERYQKLLKEKGDIVNRVPDKHLSTLLGITPVSLSRIRKRIAGGHH